MRTVLSLLKLQIDNKTDLLKTASPKTMIPAVLRIVVLLALAVVGIGFALSRIFNLGFIINAELMAIVLVITQLISLFFAIGTVINTLYLSKDNEMLVCLPVTPNQLFISKLLMIYLNELFVSSAISLPLFITLGTFARFGAVYYLSIPILLLVLPVFPIVVAAFVSIPIMWLLRFLKRHTVLAIVGLLVGVSVVMWAYVSVIGSIAGEFNIASEQYETVREINKAVAALGCLIPVYYQLGQAMLDFGLWYFYLIFILICVLISLGTIAFTRHFFFRIAMQSLENTVKDKLRVSKSFKGKSTFASLFLKELYCIFRSPSEVFEYFLFTLLMPFIVFTYDKLLMSITVNQAGENMIAGAHVMVVAILAMLSNIASASAISRDGANFHQSKTIPVSYYTQMAVKFFFNAVFTVGALILTAIVSSFIYPVWQVLLGTVAVAMAAIGHIAYSIDSDIKDPTVNLEGNEGASTVSKCTPKCIVYGLIVGFILGIIVILMSSLEAAIIPYLIIIALSFVFMVYRVYTLVLRINLAYDKIEM
ncbi:MAG: hypothetical protein IKC32_00855 [Clostridia bacterium]|nr:hypothetical protein [Clostridia bacterium]